MSKITKAEKLILKKYISSSELSTSLTLIREAMEAIWANDAPRIVKDYTDHGVEHSERVAGFVDKLLKVNSGAKFAEKEIYLLLAGVYLHDIGMQCDIAKYPVIKEKAERLGAEFKEAFIAKTTNECSLEEQGEIRKNHHLLSAAWIDYLYEANDPVLSYRIKSLPYDLVNDLMDICKFHSKLSINDCTDYFNDYPYCRKKMVAALLRFADELDISSTRVKIETVKIFSIDSKSSVYWWLHNYTKINFVNSNKVCLKVHLHPEDFKLYGSLIHKSYILNFKCKNQSVLNILVGQKIPVVIDEKSNVMAHDRAERLPPEIADLLDKMKNETNFCNLPHSESIKFVGRVSILKEINDLLSSNEGNSVAVVGLSGLGGVGKSQLALEYAYGHQKDIKIICWLKAEESDSLELGYFELGDYLNVPFNKEMKKEERIKRIRCILEERKDWLLIFDNARTKEDIDNYLPRKKAGQVLVTSRNLNWENMTKVIEVDVFTPSESVEYISQSINKINDQIVDEPTVEANKLAVELGNLPLALSQACAFIREKEIKISTYLKLFEQFQKDIFMQKESLLKDYPNTVATTWSISIKELEESCPDCIYLLNLCSFMAPEDIPIELIKKGSSLLPWNGIEIFSDKSRMENALLSLKDYSLVKYENKMLSVHRLVQLVTRSNVGKDKIDIWIGSLIKIINALLPDNINIKENRAIYYQLLPHLSNIIRLTEKNPIQDKDINKNMISVVDKVGTFLFNTSDFKGYIGYQKKCLNICQKIGDRQRESSCYTKLGTAYNRLGDYQKDKKYQEKSLKICQEIHNHQGESKCYCNLGKAFHNLCNFWKAIEYQNQSLKICLDIGDRQGESNCYIDLGNAYYRLGDFKKDIKYQKKGLEICEEIKDPSGESKFYTNLGNAYLILGYFSKAIEYQEKSLKICLDVGDKQGTSTCYNNLGVAYHSLSDYEKAREYLRESIIIDTEIGDREGEIKCYGNIGNVYHSLGDFWKAREYQEKSLKVCTEISDRQGKSTCYKNLSNIYQSLDDHEKAREYLEKSLKIDIEIGDRYGETKCYSNLGSIYYNLDDFRKAIEYENQSLKICLDVGDRLNELKCYTILSKAYHSLGDSKNANKYEEKSTVINREINKEIDNVQGEMKCYTIFGDLYNRLS